MSLALRAGAHSAAREAACAAVLQRVREAGVEQVRVVWADVHGSFRGKTVVCTADALQAALQDGIGLVSTLLLKDTSDRTAFKVFEPDAMRELGGCLADFSAAANVLLLPDPTSFTVLPWAPDTGWLRAEPFFEDGRAVPIDPRRVLQQALARLADEGLVLHCGLEVEFHIHRIEDDGLATTGHDAGAWPAEPSVLRHIHPGYQLLSEQISDLASEPLAIVRRTALALGLPLRSLEIELGPSQVEAVFAPTDALTAADQMLVFRNAMRQALRRAGYQASFVCRPPLPGAVASGWHLHQSLQDAQGRNAMRCTAPQGDADDARQCLSDTGAHWLAGLLVHAPGMAAICAPTIPAYSRYQGSVMAPQAAVWGRDNRGAMLRVLGTGSEATRIENRLGEPMANPYLTMAAHIHAGLHGLHQRLRPPPACAAPYAADATDAAGPAALPASLGEALQALAEDSVLTQGLGAPMTQVYLALKRQELARHALAEDPLQWERREYFGRY